MVLKIYVSMNYAPPDKFGDVMTDVVNAGIDGLHFDIPQVQPGQEQRFTPKYIDSVVNWLGDSQVVVDVKLLYAPQTELITQYAKTCVQRITLPKDAFKNDKRKLVECINQLKNNNNKRVGVSVKLNDAESLRDFGFINAVNHFYIQGSDLSTNEPLSPGVPGIVKKLASFKIYSSTGLEIIVEGNVSPAKAAELSDAGASIIVVGPALFRSKDYRSYLDSLRHPSTAAVRR